MSILPLPTSPTGRHHSASNPATVLVVEDDVGVREAVAMMLEDSGFRVETAVNGDDGLQKFQQLHPDVVLTDILMPEKEGIGLIRDLRREQSDVKIIAMSGGGRMGNSDYVTIATKLGADAGLRKPFDDEQLLRTVRSVLESAPPASVLAA